MNLQRGEKNMSHKRMKNFKVYFQVVESRVLVAFSVDFEVDFKVHYIASDSSE